MNAEPPAANIIILEGGVFAGTLMTDRPVPDGVVLSLAVQDAACGNGQRRIQRSHYKVDGGIGKLL